MRGRAVGFGKLHVLGPFGVTGKNTLHSLSPPLSFPFQDGAVTHAVWLRQLNRITMDKANLEKQFGRTREEARYLSFQHSKPGSGLNKYSSTLTREHDFPAAQAMLYAAGVPNEHVLKTYPQVGVASVWWEGNPCNMHLLTWEKR